MTISHNEVAMPSPDKQQEQPSLDSLGELASERFAWRWEDTTIAGQNRRLAVASDPDGMLIQACERQDAGEEGVIDPFWAATWRAATGMDQFLDRIDLQGKRVLELGCGTGHAGLAAAHRGADVLLTDGVTDPLLLVRMSVWELQDRCRVQLLRFGVDQLDEPRFPLILGSDVTYLRELWPELDKCLRQHLTPGGTVLLSDPFRFIANEFRGWIQEHGWEYQEHKVELKDDPKHPIRVMELHLPK